MMSLITRGRANFTPLTTMMSDAAGKFSAGIKSFSASLKSIIAKVISFITFGRFMTSKQSSLPSEPSKESIKNQATHAQNCLASQTASGVRRNVLKALIAQQHHQYVANPPRPCMSNEERVTLHKAPTSNANEYSWLSPTNWIAGFVSN